MKYMSALCGSQLNIVFIYKDDKFGTVRAVFELLIVKYLSTE